MPASSISKVIASTWTTGQGGIRGVNITSANIIIAKIDTSPKVNGLDLQTGTIAILNDGSGAFIKTGGGSFDWDEFEIKITPKQLTVTSDYSINPDTDKIIYIDTTLNDVEITLPLAVNVVIGDATFVIKRIAGDNDISIITQGSDLLEGNSQLTFQEIGVGNISLTISTNCADSWYLI